MSIITTLLSGFSRAAIAFAAAGLVVMTVITGWQIYGRYILNDTPNWSERSSIFLMNWYILLAAAAGVREQFHLGLVFFREGTKGRTRLTIDTIVHLLVGSFGIAMVIFGSRLAIATWTHTIPTLGISNGWSYLPVPIAGVLITIFSLEHLYRLFTVANPKDAE